MKAKLYVCIVFIAILTSGCSDPAIHADYRIIPLPQSVEELHDSEFVLDSDVVIEYEDGHSEIEKVAGFLAGYIEQAIGYKPVCSIDTEQRSSIRLKINKEIKHPEGYRIAIDHRSILVEGHSEAGVFYGVQTLRKSIPPAKGRKVKFGGVIIEDHPRFPYRGMMLDVSRHFFPTEFIKRYIDLLAMHNVNKLHLHLTEDQGWRIEIKSYPKLTETGSQRKETIKGFVTGEYDKTPHGGYYTQDELRDIVGYAKDRYIEVIPEIDLPGHMLAALASYPGLGCTGGPYEVAAKWGIHADVLCGGNEQTYEFLENVFTEILDIFPSQYIHVGGDECPKVRWKECPRCQDKITLLGLKDDKTGSKESKLQSHLTHWLGAFIDSKGRKLIGWDEIIEGGLAPNATVMSWRGREGGRFAVQAGHDVIMAPNSHLYFDYYQTENTLTEPPAFPEVNTIEEVYGFDPIPEDISDEQAKHVIGVQANLFTEQISTENHIEYMTLPRLAALAELQWTRNERKGYHSFLDRLQHLIAIYDKLGYHYSVVAFEPVGELMEDKENRTLKLKLSTYDRAPVFYTLDGSGPTINSKRYTAPVELTGKGCLKACAIRGNELIDKNLYVQPFDVNKATLAEVKLLTGISKYFNAPKGGELLVDGLRGNGCHVFGNPTSWLGFGGKMEVVIDLNVVQEINTVTTGVLLVPNSRGVRYAVSLSEDGGRFDEVFLQQVSFNAVADLTADFVNRKTRYVKIGIVADNHAHILVDEINIK